jgi:lipoate-protein ligase A
VWRGRKFSGNAQRRRQTHLLFHGTLLLNFDLALATRYLPMPSRAPAYRAARPHSEFLTNLPLAPAAVKEALQSAWGAEPSDSSWPTAAVRRLVEEKYARAAWHRSR